MIARDGSLVSIWQNNMDAYTTTNTHIKDTVYDVAIVGGGITGISAALQLQLSGKRCVLMEANNIAFGTTGGTTAHINTLLDTPYTTIKSNFGEKNAQLVAESVAEAIDFIKKNINNYSINCDFEEAKAFIFTQNTEQTEELQEIYEASAQAGIKVKYTNNIPVPIPFDKVMRVDGQAKFHPLKYVYALAKAFENAGGIILQQCRVINVIENDLSDIETSMGDYQAKSIIYATHIPMGVNLLHLRCIPYRSYALAMKLKAESDYPADLCYDSAEPYHYYRTHIIDGQKYLIAGGGDHRTGEKSNTDKLFLELEAYFRHFFHIEEVAYKWSSQYYEPADGLPYIGHLPGHSKNMYVATGFSGNGMVYSGVAAMLLTDLINGRENKYADIFNPNRIKPVAGFVNFIKHNFTVAKDLISGCTPQKITELAEIAPGEGKVVKYEHHKIAIYKDDRSNLHALNSTCTHMGCCVAWNSSEKSWDCPCHGARFDCDGNVLNGPASTALHRIDITETDKE